MGPSIVEPLVHGLDHAPVEGALVAMATVAALALAAVFAVAAVAKATGGASATAEEFAELGLPWPGLLARTVPPAEMAVALTVLWRPALGATLASLALLAFTAVLIASLRAGRRVSCGCLGSLDRRPVSPRTVVRNGALLALAALAATAPGATGWRPTAPTLELVLSLGLISMSAAVVGQLVALRNQTGRIWSVELAGERARPPEATNRIDDPKGSAS